MSFVVNTYSLSAITPVKFVYKYNTEEKIAGSYASIKGDFAYYKHDALVNFKDVALSRKTCLMLTDVKNVRDVFETSNTNYNIGEITGTLLLKVRDKLITETEGSLYVGGTGKPILITVVPVGENLAELRVNRTNWIQIDQTYPYTARLSQDVVDDSELQFRRFYIEYSQGLICFKVKTPEGYRFLSHGVDNVLRAVGLELNDTIVNSYHFEAEYKTRSTINYNYTPDEKEVKYYNDVVDQRYKTNVKLKEVIDSQTNLLISCPTNEISKSKEVVINISSLKTNYNPSGTFSPSI